MKKIIWTIILLITIGMLPQYLHAESIVLDFNEANSTGTNWPGWSWSCTDVSYSNCGWYKTNYSFINNTRLPRLYEKTDYGNRSSASIDTANKAPSSTSGGSLLIFDNGRGTTFQPSWWFDNENNMQSKGIAVANHDRLSMYVKLEGLPTYTNPDSASLTFELGTYTCWENGGYGGVSCPYESNNGHWYHQSQIQPGAWIHILWDEHPTHRRNVSDSYPPNNPTMVESGKDYFANLFRFYLQFMRNVTTPNTAKFWVDEIKFTSATELGEPNQNDISIANVWIGYWPSDQHWEIGWNDLSSKVNKDSEYEIRWSTNPINNTNWTAATIIVPLDYRVNTNHLHKSNTWKSNLWTRFNLPSDAVLNNNKLYFAIKDVSQLGGLYVNSPSSNIHTIDYNLRPTINQPIPSPTLINIQGR